MGCVRNAIPPRLPLETQTETVAPLTCVDGDVVRVSAAASLTLRCGKASVTLTRDGKVLINGSYVETRASSTNRIQGGSVRIN